MTWELLPFILVLQSPGRALSTAAPIDLGRHMCRCLPGGVWTRAPRALILGNVSAHDLISNCIQQPGEPFIAPAINRMITRYRGEMRGNLGPSKFRAALESAIALSAGSLGLVTVFWHDWIETLTGWNPDQHNGAAEWLIVAVLLTAAAIAGLAARRSWRLLAARPGPTAEQAPRGGQP